MILNKFKLSLKINILIRYEFPLFVNRAQPLRNAPLWGVFLFLYVLQGFETTKKFATVVRSVHAKRKPDASMAVGIADEREGMSEARTKLPPQPNVFIISFKVFKFSLAFSGITT